MGHVDSLSAGEAKLTSAHQLRPPSTNRAWDYWVRQIEKSGLVPAKGAAKSAGKRPAAPAKRAASKSASKPAKKPALKSRAKKRR